MRRALVLVIGVWLLVPGPVRGREVPQLALVPGAGVADGAAPQAVPAKQRPRPARRHVREADFRRFSDYLWLLFGAASGLVLHESGHLIMDFSLQAAPKLVAVKLGPFPFFAIQPTVLRSNQDRYAITVAGFAVQDLWSELILGLSPRVMERHHPFLKGMLAFHIVVSLGYAISGFAGVGPPQSDVGNMAYALGVPQWVVACMLTVPALADLYRYFVPDSRWAPWVSLGSKLSAVGISFAF